MMEYSGQKRSNFFLAGIVWFFYSLYILLKALPYQLPLKPITTVVMLHLAMGYFVFIAGILIVACLTRDSRLLTAYAVYSVIVLMLIAARDVELERELVEKIRNYLLGYFVMPYWGLSRLFEEKTEAWISAWCALSGAIAFFGTCLCRRK